MRDVAVIGIGITKFGELWERSFRDIGIEAGIKAINDAGISGSDIDALYIGNMSAGAFIRQEHVAALIADYVGLAQTSHIPAIRVEAAGASGAVAFREAFLSIASGMHDIVVVGGAEKMTDIGDEMANAVQGMAIDQEWETVFGATYASLHAMMARAHMEKYGTTREQLAMVSVINHRHGALNPDAQFRREINVDTVLRSGMVAEPLRVFDMCPLSDGAATIVLASMDAAKKFTDRIVKVRGIGQGSDTIALHDRRDITTIDATVYAAKRAYDMAGIKAKDVDVAEVYDSSTISEIMAIEDLGFFEKGTGGKAVEEERIALGNEIPVNTSGGLKSRGHPVGATGIAQIVEIVKQLRGEADGRQVKDAKIGLAHAIGGTGGTAVVSILEGCE